MACGPMGAGAAPQTDRSYGLSFAPELDAYSRNMQNAAVMMSAPWTAYWALASEMMNPQNYQP